MTDRLSDNVLNVADLVGRPGSSRRLDLALDVPSDLVLPLADVTEPVRLRGVVESVVDGLLVRGQLGAVLRLSCARCLQPLSYDASAEVVELFVDPATADEEVEAGYEVRDARIDLDTLLRDSLATAAPYQPLCRADCRGLCAVCGADLNDAACDCRDETTDPRWAALRGLSLPDDT